MNTPDSTFSAGRRRARHAAVATVLAALTALTIAPVLPAEASDATSGRPAAWSQTFRTNVALGKVSAKGLFPGYPVEQLYAYPNGIGKGTYQATSTLSISDHVLTLHAKKKGPSSSVTVLPSAIGGTWSIRMRTQSMNGVHVAVMLWPDNDVWPGKNGSGGEIDWPEEDATTSTPYVAVVGNAGDIRDGRQAHYPVAFHRAAKSWHNWHTYTIVLNPGKSVTVYQDSKYVATVTQNVPRTHVHMQIQVGNTWWSPKAKLGTGVVQVSKVSYTPSTAKLTQPAPAAKPKVSAASALRTDSVSATADDTVSSATWPAPPVSDARAWPRVASRTPAS